MRTQTIAKAARQAEAHALVRRIGKLEGQLRGVALMIVRGRPYDQILTQIAAIRGGLDGLALAAGRAERLLTTLKQFLRTV